MAEVKLLGLWVSPFSRRVELGLNLKGVEYEYVEENLSNKSPLLLQSNPVHKKVPVLIHNGNLIAESLVILEYIDEAFDGPPILPKDPYERAKARFWAKFLDEKCMHTMRNANYSTGDEREKAKEEATEMLRFLENEIKGKRFFGGDNIGLVDIAANFIAWYRILSKEFIGVQVLTEDKFPNLCKWADDFCNCSFVKDSLPPKDRLVEKFKPLIQAAAAMENTSTSLSQRMNVFF